MKILFSVGELERNLNATTKIVCQLAAEMCRQGHSCAVAGECSVYPKDETVDGVLLKRLPSARGVVKASEAFDSFFKEKAADRNSARGTFVKKHPFHSVFLFLKYNPSYIKYQQKRYLKQIKQFAEEFKPDAVVTVCKPILPFETVAAGVDSCPVYLYQVDPFGLHRIDNPQNKNGFIARETRLFHKAAHIFTTPVLLEQYGETAEYSGYTEKMTAVEFPNIKKHSLSADVKSAIDFDESYTNILFCGIVTDDFRSPEPLLQDLETLFKAGEKVRVYFLGDNMSKAVDAYRGRYPENVFTADRVDAQTALATMNAADVLFNVSNTLDNQVPSKIFDYFSTGKPVINLQKIENCPAAEYFERYPLGFTVKEWETRDCRALMDFLAASKGKQLDFAEVEAIYRTATVEYVAKQMTEIFEKNL